MQVVYNLNLVCLLLIFAVDQQLCFDIERRVTEKKTLPYPSADRFSNPSRSFCAIRRTSCSRLGAKCSSTFNCCTCECRGHLPNFLSTSRGCLSTYSLSVNAETHCLYTLERSGSMFVPTFTSYTDFGTKDLELLLSYAPMSDVLTQGDCKASTIYYIDERGVKWKLFENECSEFLAIEKQGNNEKDSRQILRWKWTINPRYYWNKLQGKLLKIEIRCKSRKRAVNSCLLFKVGGAYNVDTFIDEPVESSMVCPKEGVLTSTRKPTIRTTTARSTTAATTKPKTSSDARTEEISTMSPSTQRTPSQTSVIYPPATLIDIETTAAMIATSTEDLITDRLVTTGRKENNEGGNARISTNNNDKNKHGINWLVTGLIITVAILLVILAASLSVLFRKKCKKRAQRNTGEFAMNVVYHATVSSPEYDEATLPSKGGCIDGEINDNVDGNLYESIDNLSIKGACAATYDYAFNDPDATKVKLTDEKQPIPPRPNQNEYEVAFRPKPEHTYNTPVIEEYADMSLYSEEKPVCYEKGGYENLPDSNRISEASGMTVPADDVYEEMEPATSHESQPLVAESYIEPEISAQVK